MEVDELDFSSILLHLPAREVRRANPRLFRAWPPGPETRACEQTHGARGPGEKVYESSKATNLKIR